MGSPKLCGWSAGGLILALATVLGTGAGAGCGGGNKQAAPVSSEAEDSDDSEPAEPTVSLIPDEKLDSINRSLERRSRSIGRCYSTAVEAGDMDKGERGTVLVSFTIQPNGKPSNVRITQATVSSKTLKECVIDDVSRMSFTTLPRPLDYSYSFGFDAL